jgi:hypothetical protein
MRQSAKHQIGISHVNLVDFLQEWQRQMRQMWKDVTHRKASLPIRRQRNNLHLRMQGNQAHKLRTGVAARAKNDNLMCHCKIPCSPSDMERMPAIFKPPLRLT